MSGPSEAMREAFPKEETIVEWEKGQVVQIDPDHDETFGACFMVISEPKAWGAQGYVQIPGKTEDQRGQAYYRCPTEAMHLIGKAEWRLAE